MHVTQRALGRIHEGPGGQEARLGVLGVDSGELATTAPRAHANAFAFALFAPTSHTTFLIWV